MLAGWRESGESFVSESWVESGRNRFVACSIQRLIKLMDFSSLRFGHKTVEDRCRYRSIW